MRPAFIGVKIVIHFFLSAMIANVLIEIYRNSSAINVWMVVYFMIICKTPIYTWNMVVKMMDMIICKTAICILESRGIVIIITIRLFSFKLLSISITDIRTPNYENMKPILKV